MTKKIAALIVSLAGLYSTSNAQFSNTSFLLGGQAAYSSVSTDNINYPSVNKSGNFNLQFGKTVNESTVVGITLLYGGNSSQTGDTTYGSINKNRNYGFGIFGRKYKQLAKNLYFFGEAGVNYVYGRQTITPMNPDNEVVLTSASVQVAVMPGIAYNICKNLQIELLIPNVLNLNYKEETTKYPNPAEIKNTYFNVSSSLQSNPLENLGVGFKFLL